MSLNGKHALITGSSRGIGRGIALKLAASGVKVAIHYYQNEAAAVDTLARVRKLGADGLVVQADVLRPEQITQMFRKVQGEFGKLDIFVSNARPEAATFFYPPMEITLEQWNAASDSQAKAFLLAVGYCTIYGDMAGGLAVISDVPKTMVYELARWINSDYARRAIEVNRPYPSYSTGRGGSPEPPAAEIIPRSTIEKAPSAELKPNQKD